MIKFKDELKNRFPFAGEEYIKKASDILCPAKLGISNCDKIDGDCCGIENKLTIIDRGSISDDSHTFDELYYHRCILFSVICNSNKPRAWKSWKHEDGTMFPDYFIVGIETPMGQFSYHYHKDMWDKFNVQELAHSPKWDGHTPDDIVRLLSLLPIE